MAAGNRSERLADSPTPLQQLAPDELELLNSFAHNQRFRAGEVIFRKGDPGTSMMSIVKGRVKISATSPGGGEAVLAILGPGEVLGEMAVLDDKDRSATATTLEACEVMVLQKSDIVTIMDQNPSVCMRLLRILSERLRRSSSLVEEQAFVSLSARLAKVLLDLAGRNAAAGTRVYFDITRESFDGPLGASRVDVEKLLLQWQASGLLTLESGYIVLARPESLARFIEIG